MRWLNGFVGLLLYGGWIVALVLALALASLAHEFRKPIVCIMQPTVHPLPRSFTRRHPPRQT